MRLPFLGLLGGIFLPALEVSAPAADTPFHRYLEEHCLDCHDSSTKKGGLDFEATFLQLDKPDNFAQWTRVHDRIAKGEMPPKSRREQPSTRENSDVLMLLDARLHDADSARISKTGRTAFRRLTAQEYENALRDLLHLPGLRIKHLLPEDERRHGYDKIAQALDFSNVHLNQFMDAAELALSAAIATRSSPPPVLKRQFGAATGTETWNWIARGDAVLLKDKQFDPLLPLPDAHESLWGKEGSDHLARRRKQLGHQLQNHSSAVGYFTGPVERTFVTSLQFSPVYAGPYRIRTSAWGFWWNQGSVEEPHRNESFMLSVWLPLDGPRFVHSPSRRLGMFDVASRESRVHEYTGWLDVNEELLFEMGTPTGYEKNHGRWVSQWPGSCTVYSGPGIALDWFEVEGPLFEQWPPRSHQALLGSLPIREFPRNSDMLPPKRLPVRQHSHTASSRPQNADISKEEREPRLETVASENPPKDAARLLEAFLPRAFRRSVPAQEIDSYVQIALREMGRHLCFEDAMKEAYKTALCSVDFLFTGEPVADKPGVEAPASRIRLSGRSLAERLALWLWNSVPDEELTALAHEGRLHERVTLQKQINRLLSDPRSERFIADFVGQWLDLRKIDATQPDTRLYPEYREHLKESIVAETRAYFRELITHNLSVTHLVHSRFAMLNQSLADHYGIPHVTGSAIRRVPLPEGNPRGPFLTQAAILKVTANGTTTSPVTRGAWINERILGNPIPPPPPGVPAIDPDTRGTKTIREQLERHRSDARCAGCHAKIDPPGFVLESFDVIGGFRERYRALSAGDQSASFAFASGWNPRIRLAQPVDPSGQLPSGEAFSDLAAFQALIQQNPEALAENMVRQFLLYGTGAEIHYSDRREIARIVAQTRSQSYGIRSLLEAIIHSDLFLTK